MNRGIFLALVHHPVVNRRGEVIASAVTNLDLHDIARASACYGVRRFYVVTPVEDQRELAERIMDHWRTGAGAAFNPDRREAFSRVVLCATLEEAVEDAASMADGPPLVVATTARETVGALGFADLRGRLAERACLLVFGTASGLAEEILDAADAVLAPVSGPTDYNHLSVRSAVSVILDRLAGAGR